MHWITVTQCRNLLSTPPVLPRYIPFGRLGRRHFLHRDNSSGESSGDVLRHSDVNRKPLGNGIPAHLGNRRPVSRLLWEIHPTKTNSIFSPLIIRCPCLYRSLYSTSQFKRFPASSSFGSAFLWIQPAARPCRLTPICSSIPIDSSAVHTAV